MPVNITKNGREHTFPLGTLSLKLLQVFTATTGILFPGKSLSPFNGWSKVKAALDTASGVTDGTLHDLRRTFATNLAQLGVAPHGTTVGDFDRADLPESALQPQAAITRGRRQVRVGPQDLSRE